MSSVVDVERLSEWADAIATHLHLDVAGTRLCARCLTPALAIDHQAALEGIRALIAARRIQCGVETCTVCGCRDLVFSPRRLDT